LAWADVAARSGQPFTLSEGQGGSEFYTPSSIVKLLAEVIEPYHGRILDPACGSGGMFVQSARFVAEHQKNPAGSSVVHAKPEALRPCRYNHSAIRSGDGAAVPKQGQSRLPPIPLAHSFQLIHSSSLVQTRRSPQSAPVSRTWCW
jgi:hypothetical protein